MYDYRVVPVSAHAAFDKAAEYLRIKLHTIPVDPETRRVDISRMKRAMYVVSLYLTLTRHLIGRCSNSNTIMV